MWLTIACEHIEWLVNLQSVDSMITVKQTYYYQVSKTWSDYTVVVSAVLTSVTILGDLLASYVYVIKSIGEKSH